MAFDMASFVAEKTKKPTGGFDVNAFLLSKGIQPKTDLSTVGGLQQHAENVGLGKEAAKIATPTPKLSPLQRLGTGLSAFNPGNAQFKTIEAIKEDQYANGLTTFFGQYGKDIASGLGSAITGKPQQQERKYFSDVAGQLGIENGIAKFGIG